MDEAAVKRPKRLRTKAIILVSFFIAALIATAGIVYWRKLNNPIPFRYTHSLKFPLYYPYAILPTGYYVDKSSYKMQNDVFIFTIITPNGHGIAVAEQALPTDIDLSVQNPSGLKRTDIVNFTAPAGQAQASLWGDKTVVSIVTPKTWLILNVTGIEPAEAKHVARAFSQLN